ncbi:M61 family metallopeptidase [Zobellia galactanivorans]|uniref:Glycyl aminopeptidase, family M61 n=1 Tax=Zobellia galactanivorans (strain DSM 12802 / CCUG 47099 / CIP 106680 / NCIMB 13871 / Dsij) TaxID=63186 RepID=G0LBX1_ZOBGA|nr:peptidase M61 [Zobellia galactanivorans]CAZ96497.1 Glycyl aminopeptidase, family M61 [Zobellia galactanivorans]
MRKIGLLAFAVLLAACGATKTVLTADKAPVLAKLDLKNVVDDKVAVTVDAGAFTTDEVLFYIPKTVPGTYSTDNYGQYIEGFKALDYEGKELTFSKLDDNTWKVSNGKNLDKVTYWVNDTYDTEGEVKDKVFSPSGTNINAGKTFMLNLHGFVGYFGGLKEVPYELSIVRPEALKPTTSLTPKVLEAPVANVDVFSASRYFDVIDNPILYAKPNTETFEINGITVTLSVYSPSGIYSALSLKDRMEKMMGAQKTFLGDVDGTKIYNILLYLSTMEADDASGFGALEHHTSTVVVLPEAMPKERLEQAMVDVVSHEFFHIVTPLNVHSEEVQYFDFNDPKMSQHLWMYEGTTEYFANLFQIQQGLIDEGEFYQRMMDKINNAKSYDDAMSFTEMSKNILVDPYKKNYANVYEKGALINMVLDIQLRQLSNGEKGVLWLMKELSKKYGNDTPFEDDKLIDEIVAMTYPEIRTFFDTYVIGDTPIDYNSYLGMVGLSTDLIEQETGYFLDGDNPFIDVEQGNENVVFIRKGIQLNSFFKGLGAEGGDIIKEINGTAVTLESIRPIIGKSFGWSPDTEISMVVDRDGKEVLLEGKVGAPTVNVETIVPVENVSDEVLELRQAWLKG